MANYEVGILIWFSSRHLFITSLYNIDAFGRVEWKNLDTFFIILLGHSQLTSRKPILMQRISIFIFLLWLSSNLFGQEGELLQKKR